MTFRSFRIFSPGCFCEGHQRKFVKGVGSPGGCWYVFQWEEFRKANIFPIKADDSAQRKAGVQNRKEPKRWELKE